MSNASIRQQLHQYIDFVEDKKIEALYTLLQDEVQPAYIASDEELNLLHQRAEKYMNGNAETYTVEEAHEKVRQQRKIV